LKSIPFREDMKLPRWVGHIVNDLVWDRLAPGLREKLNEKNPVVTETGRRKHKNFQWLTEEVGNPALLYHLGMLEGLAKGYGQGEYDMFHKHVDRALPRYPRFKTLFSEISAESARVP
ncbi:MAG: P63C domain-containing protein, partial [Mycobacterium sp.]